MLAQLKETERSALPLKGMFSFQLTLLKMIREMMCRFFSYRMSVYPCCCVSALNYCDTVGGFFLSLLGCCTTESQHEADGSITDSSTSHVPLLEKIGRGPVEDSDLVPAPLSEVLGGGSASVPLGTCLPFSHRPLLQPQTSPPLPLEPVLWHLVPAGGADLFALGFISNTRLRVVVCCKQVPLQVSSVKSICLLLLLKSEKAAIS